MTWRAVAQSQRLRLRFILRWGEMFHQATLSTREATNLNVVALSGGVFQNRLFLRLMRDRLTASDFEVMTHEQVPANDGGVEFGAGECCVFLISHNSFHTNL